MASDAFATHKQGLVTKQLERPKNLSEETARFWGRMRAGHYDFLRRECDKSYGCSVPLGSSNAGMRVFCIFADEVNAETIRALTLAEVLNAYDAYILPSSPTRRKLSVQLVSQQTADAPPAPNPATQEQLLVEDLDEADDLWGAFARAERAFKAGLACAPAATPVHSAAFGEYGV